MSFPRFDGGGLGERRDDRGAMSVWGNKNCAAKAIAFTAQHFISTQSFMRGTVMVPKELSLRWQCGHSFSMSPV